MALDYMEQSFRPRWYHVQRFRNLLLTCPGSWPCRPPSGFADARPLRSHRKDFRL